MAESARFWNKVALRYAKQPIKDQAVYNKKLAMTQAYFKPEMQLLELGCGTGSTAILHAPHVNHIHAVDISSDMLDIAQHKVTEQGIQNISFECTAVAKVKLQSETYDGVLALSLLHLLEDKEATICKVYETLKPGGVFITSTVCLGDNMKFIKFIAPIGRFFGFFPLLKVFKASQLEKALIDAGFAIEKNWQPGKNKAVFIIARKPL
ncbi:class I SAM-dependent methyltransferase [Marinicella sp. W31]|uniref:class I SAM-dependent methyltransferase n=1 Tax=Marinicella sp. W31 TaxID=3023713 RepID=UPI003756E1A1